MFERLFTKPDGTPHGGKIATWLTIATILAAGFEGYAAHPYVDRVGTGHPITWCYGETKADGPVPKMTATFSEAHCKAELAKKLETVYGPAVEKCIPGMPPHRKAAIVDAAYNLGPGAICQGPIARYLNTGNVAAGCKALLGYDHASGRVVKGLQRRRQSEYQFCMRDD
jgi:lysozyme